MWKLTYRGASHTHPNKSRRRVVGWYYGQFNKSKQNLWVFGDRVSGAYLPKFAWTKIVRHAMVLGAASPRRAATSRRPTPTNPTRMGTVGTSGYASP